MKRTVRIIVVSIFIVFGATPLNAEQVGLIPIPVLENVGVETQVSFDSTTGLYNYSYTISNPGSNTGDIVDFDVDVRRHGGMELSSEGLTIPMGRTIRTFDELLIKYKGLNHTNMVPFGQNVPSGWAGGPTASGFAAFGGMSKDVLIQPGVTMGGFEIISRGLPAIRDVMIDPDWVFMVDDLEAVTPEEEKRAHEVEDEIRFVTKTVGPFAPPRDIDGNLDVRNMLTSKIYPYISQSSRLGWITDPELATALKSKAVEILQSVRDNDISQAITGLDAFIGLLDDSSSAQRTSDAYGLLYFNAKHVRDYLFSIPPEVEIKPDFKIELTPEKTSLITGSPFTLTARFTKDGAPISLEDQLFGMQVYLYVIDQWGYWDFFIDAPEIQTDENGNIFFNVDYEHFFFEAIWGPERYEDTRFEFVIGAISQHGLYLWGNWLESNFVEVVITGGPDLVLDYFIPPVIKVREQQATLSDAPSPLLLKTMYASLFTTGGGQEITITEQISNKGTAAAGPSVIRYYLSEDEEIDQWEDTYIGERQVPSLEPGESSKNGGVQYTLPADLPAGTYYMGAIVDADAAVYETGETNNNQSAGEGAIYVAVEEPTNQPPDCTQAGPTISSIWPANHKLVDVGVFGVTDPDDDEVTLKVTGITQDEPVNGLGDGDMSPDGFGVGFDKAEVRAERSGTGNGRVYAVSFSADDGNGGICTGSVNVRVPRDRNKRSAAVNDGQNYNSMLP